MFSLNKVQIIGNVTADPEIRETPNGSKVCSISIATNRRYKDKAGMLQDETEFHNVVLWTFLADTAERFLKKGNKVYVEGRLQTRSWEDQAGTKRYKTEIIGENMIVLTPKGGNSTNTEESPLESAFTSEQPAKTKTVKPKVEEEIRIEDVPF